MRPPVSPRDCAVLVAVPTTRDEFMRAAAAKCAGAFVDRILRGRSAAWGWDQIYGPIAEQLTRVLSDIEATGATVRRAATLADLAAVAGHAQVVTLIAHWRFPGLQRADVLQPAAVLAAAQAATSGPLKGFSAADADDLIAQLCAEVLAGEQVYRDLEGQDVAIWTGDVEEPQAHLQRIELEAVLPAEVLRRAGVVEFADGFQTAEAIISAISADFAGVVDLSICNSAVLGVALRQRRRRCLCILKRRESPLGLAAVMCRAVIRLLAQSPQPYVDAILSIHRSIITRLP